MNRQYSFKRTEETEIDLADLMKKCCSKWKQIVVCALAAAAVLGGLGWLKSRNVTDVQISGAETDVELTQEEDRGVADAVRLEKEIRALEEYLENSRLMQLDPYHKHRMMMLYSVCDVKRQDLAAVTESYLNFITNGGAAGVLAESSGRWQTGRSYLAEMITAYQKTYSTPYQITADALADKEMLAESIFYVEITGTDEKEAEAMAADIQKVLKEYSDRVKKTAGSHRLRLLSSTAGTAVDFGLQTQQHDKRTQLSANRINLKAAVDAFSEEQKIVYQNTLPKESTGSKGEDVSDSVEDQSDEMLSGGSYKSVLKYALIGIFAGVFLYAGIFTCMYIFSDTVKNTEELKRIYTFPVYGQIQTRSRGMSERKESYGNTEDQILNRIRIACKIQGIEKLCAVSDSQLTVTEREYLNKIAARLASCGIDLSVTENASTDTDAWDGLVETGNFLLICKIGTATYHGIDDALNFYLENGMTAAGAVVFC